MTLLVDSTWPFLWVVGSGTCTFKQKMPSQDLDGVVGKMHDLITN
jgi:hypothetical protein